MTQQTALEIFNMMIEEFQRHYFNDIGTFTLPRIEKQNEFDDYDLNYKYSDSVLAFRELEIEAQNPQRTHSVLRRLLASSREYFELAQRIPLRFEQELSELTSAPTPEIVMETLDEKQLNLSIRLSDTKIEEMIKLIGYLEENLSQDTNDEFLNQLNF